MNKKTDYEKIIGQIIKGLAFQCECGNTTEWNKAQLQSKPDEKPIPLYMVT